MGWHFNRTGHSVLYILIFLLLGLSRPVPAHKGRVAIAMHLEGIRLDGDLGDWPTTLPWYPISQAVYGRHPQDEADYTGRFKIGYNTRQNTLLLAVEVQDQTIVADPTAPGTWDTQDGCTVYLDVTHQAPDSPNEIYNPEQAPMQFTIYGDDYQDEGAQGRVHREKNVHSYEWEINLEKQLVPGVVMGIGVLIGDLDGDGAPTWMAWNKGLNKFMHADRLGDLILVDTPPVKVSGNLQWAGSSEGVAQGRIRFQSLKNESLKVDVEADREGFYTVSLPPGRFRMIGGFRDGEKETKTIEILTGEPSQVNLNVRPSALGSEIEHMPQQTVRSERGLRQGEWAFLGVTAPYPRTSVHSMMQDQKGNLWFGTHNNGISRYDGEQFTVFGELNEKRLGQISVSCMLEDRTGNLWFGTGWYRSGIIQKGKAYRYDGERFVAFTREDGLAGEIVICMLEDRTGNLWFGTYQNGVSRYDGRQFTTFTVEDGLADLSIASMLEDRKGNLWFGGAWAFKKEGVGGLTRYDGTRFTAFTRDDGLPHERIEALLEDRAGNLWIGTHGGGVCRYNGSTFTIFTQKDGLADDRVWSIAEDQEGNLWVATRGGLSRYDGERWTTFTREQGLPHNEVYTVFVDRQGYLWAGSAAGGIMRYEGRNRTNFTEQEGLASDGVLSILEDRTGNLWFGTRSGVSRYDGKQMASFTTENGLSQNFVNTMLQDQQDNLWFGTHDGKLSRFDGKTFANFTTANAAGMVQGLVTSLLEDNKGQIWIGTQGVLSRYDGREIVDFTTKDGLAHGLITCLLEDKKGQIWIGTQGGLSRHNGEAFVTFTVEDGLAHSKITCLLEDKKGQIWIGTQEGLSQYDGEQFIRFTNSDDIAQGSVTSLLEDTKGQIWIGTADGGLSRYNGETFVTFTIENGLVGNNISCLMEDRDGKIWLGNALDGISRYDGTAFQHLSTQDGLVNNIVTGLLQDRNGDVWIITAKGMTRYRPAHNPPAIQVTDVVADRRYGPIEELHLPSSQQYMVFHFRGRSFTTRPEQMVYVYRLKGYENQWRQSRNGRVEYLDLPRGDYVFQVKAVDQDLNYSEPDMVRVSVHLSYQRIGWMGILGLALVLIVWQAGQAVQRNRRLRESHAALSEAHTVLNQEIQERRRVEDQRAELDEQLQQLRFLDRLRSALEEVPAPEEIVRRVSQVMLDVLSTTTPGGIQIDLDGNTWTLGETDAPDQQHYQRPLAWGGRQRGRLLLFCGMKLSEAQERALLDETTGQVVRVLEARELNLQLLQSSRLVSLGQMAAGVAHELNQPLSAISALAGSVHMNLMQGQEVGEGQLQDMTREIQELVERMAGTIGHLRMFSRDTTQEPSSPFSVNEVVRSSLTIIGAQMKDHGIEVTLELAEDVYSILGHPYQMEQVVLNLLANARDALNERQTMPGDEEKSLYIRTFNTISDEAQVTLEVEDNGVGIEETHQGHIFEPFFTTKEADRGTGLGLSISYAIVRDHGGEIMCQSQKGQGSVFKVTLPAVEEIL